MCMLRSPWVRNVGELVQTPNELINLDVRMFERCVCVVQERERYFIYFI